MPKPKKKKLPKSGKKMKPKAKPEQNGPRYVMAKTTNGRIIQKMLDSTGRSPSKYKDWAVLTTGRMIDWLESYNVVGKKGPLEVDGALLVHKRELHTLLPKPLAETLWNSNIGRRVAQKGPA